MEIKEFKQNELLSKYTQIKVGGPAEYFYEAKSREGLIEAIKTAKANNLTVTILGWGSNVLVSDKGIKGLVIINKSSKIEVLNDGVPSKAIETKENNEETIARLDQLQTEIYGKFEDLDYDESNIPTTEVRFDSGVSLPLAIYKTIKADLTGLQWYAGIPGTIGGAIYNNIHGGTHFIFEVLKEVEVMDKNTLEISMKSRDELGGDYDESIFHKTNDYIISVTLNLHNGDSEKAMKTMVEWRKRKKIQPQISSGCVWQNLSVEKRESLNLPSSSIGYIIEHELGLKGKRRGDAIISDKHAAFIENKGKAKAEDILYLMNLIKSEAKEKLDIELKPEIFLLGFNESL